MTRIVVEGNDGTGKTTIVRLLGELGYTDVADRGVLTKMTDDPELEPLPDELYLIIDVPVEVSRERLARAGKDLDEQYHTVEDLTHYRRRYLEIGVAIGDAGELIDGTGTPAEVLERCLEALRRRGVNPST